MNRRLANMAPVPLRTLVLLVLTLALALVVRGVARGWRTYSAAGLGTLDAAGRAEGPAQHRPTEPNGRLTRVDTRLRSSTEKDAGAASARAVGDCRSLSL